MHARERRVGFGQGIVVVKRSCGSGFGLGHDFARRSEHQERERAVDVRESRMSRRVFGIRLECSPELLVGLLQV